MKKHILFTLFGLSVLLACTNTKNESTSNETQDSVPLAKTELPENFYKRLTGTIAGKAVVMNLQRLGGDYDGNYYYDGSWLNLANDPTIKNDSLVLVENSFYDYYFDKNGKQPRLHLKWTGNGFKGMWVSGDGTKSFPVDLMEKYPSGSYQDSVKAFANDPKSPSAAITFEYVKPTTTDETGKWLDNQLKRISGIRLGNVDREIGFKKIADAYFKDYQKEIATQQKNGPDRGFSAWMNYTNNSQQSLTYNDHGYIVIDFLADSYTGGAHGNYSSTMYCFDVQNKKQMILSDVIKIDSNTLQKLLEQNLRKQYNIKPQDQISTVLFDNFLKPNKNFYFNNNGLAFMYNPYEVASYAQGQIVVFIPFSQLKAYLNPAFAARIGAR